jgi:membrane protein DedA with SNARE-associated domain/pimeloyl-ACP methyl ester carboxylesterase
MKTLRRKTAWIYLGLLVSSWLVMSQRQVPLPAGPEWREVSISGAEGKLRYRKFAGNHPELPPVILVHGSPMASSCFDPLLAKISHERTILVPDLPGFGASFSGFPDRSFMGHAAVLEDWLKRESIRSAHWVAYSQGGGPVLEFAAKNPAAVTSLTLLSSIGVQEYELTGDYFLNHILHGAQWLALEGLRWGIPHFGLLDRVMINTHYAENFFTSDMRPLRGHLEKLNQPSLIIHGDADVLVRTASAREHFRIVPQSEAVWLNGGHMVLISQAQAIINPLEDFFHRVEIGEATTRPTANPSRLVAAARPFNPTSIMALHGTALWITLLGIALATLVSEDLACLTAGLLVARGLIPLPAGIFASLAGIWLGDMALYAAGRYGWHWLIRRAPLRWLIRENALDAARQFLNRRGAMAIFISRFTPGMRLPLYVAAGVVKMPAMKLGFWFFIAGIVWTIPVVSVAAFCGERATEWLLRTGAAIFPAALLLMLATWLLLRLASFLATHAGRRILRSKWQRLIRWEFWPPWAFYPPIVAAVLIIGLRRRNLLAFTAVNPAIPHGGISGESKADILHHLAKSGCVAPFVSLPTDTPDRLRLIRKNLPNFPLVVKPDVGERGTGVVIVRDDAALIREIENRQEDTIVQTYLEGAEFGVFYIRHPQENRGRIFSITIKKMTAVTGDGVKSLEELILDDERAYLSQQYFRQLYQDRLTEIPAAGERVVLANLGSHCRGALFLDGAHLITPALEDEMERIARCFNGFYFGRFDLRCPDEDALTRGEGIRLIELNGVTSEATHIYHPHTPLLVGYRTLISQWRQAYDIGLANAAQGAHVSTWGEFLGILRNHFNRKSH